MDQVCHILAFLFQVLFTFVSPWEPDLCQELDIRSQNLEKTRIFVKDTQGYPAVVRNVTLLGQISDTLCVKWKNFGHSGFTVVVEKGCHGRFMVCYITGIRPAYVPVHNTIECTNVRLASKMREADEKWMSQYVRGGDMIVSMDLLHQLSVVSCIRGLSFNYFDQKVEAKFGCRGDFRVCVDTLLILDHVVPDIQCEMFVLLSVEGREERFTVPLTNGGIVSMVVINEYSSHACVLGSTFGFSEKHGLEIYTKDGCQGEFDVCQSPEDLLPPRVHGETI